MKGFKKLACGLLAVTMMASLAACNDSGNDSSPAGSDASSGGGKTVKVAVFPYKASDTYIASVSKALEDFADDYNVEITNVIDCQEDQTKQNEFIDQEISKGEVDVLAVNIVDVGAASAVVQRAKDAEMPLILYNREPADAGADVYASYDKVKFVGTEIEEAGILQGEMVVAAWEAGDLDKNGDNKLQYVMLRGEDGNAEAKARTDYAISTIKDAGIDVEQLENQTATWDTAKASEIVANWISQYDNKIEVIMANNDGMAMGALTAIQNAGFNKDDDSKKINIYGVDATQEAIAKIKTGEMTATVKQDNETMAKAILQLAYNAGNGESNWTTDTDFKFDDTGNAVRIPYQKFEKAQADAS